MRVAVARRNEALDTLIDNMNGGFIRVYNGTRPTNADTALSGNTLLAQLGINATSAPSSSGGVLTLNAITSDASADASGTATFGRIFQSDGTTVVGDVSVGTGGGEFNFNTLDIVVGALVSCTSATITFPVGA